MLRACLLFLGYLISGLALSVALPVSAAVTDYIAGPGLNAEIPDGSGTDTPLLTLTSTFTISSSSVVSKVSVFASIDHTWVGDLAIGLRGPDGTIVTLMDRPGVPSVSVNGDSSDLSSSYPISFSDTAATAAELAGSACVGGDLVIGQSCTASFAPQTPLSAFNGKAVAGSWTLLITDFAGGDVGTLDGWTLRVETGTTAPTSQGVIENPQPNSYASGIGIVSGWYCDANQIDIEFLGPTLFPGGKTLFETAYGTYRGDTQSICGDTDNGFGLLINYNNLDDGVHTLRALADGVEFDRATFTVTTFGTSFLSGASGNYIVSDFPQAGTDTTLAWQQAQQNFAIQDVDPPVLVLRPESRELVPLLAAPAGALENPQPSAFASGISVISGWHCNANKIEIEFLGPTLFPGGKRLFETAYGTYRGDTQSVCGDTNNGYALLINYNNLYDGLNTVRALADGVEFARATFNVTTFGTSFLSGVSRNVTVNNFPETGTNTKLIWQQALQNFVLQEVQSGGEPVTGPVIYTGATTPAPITAAGIDIFVSGVSTYVPACTDQPSARSGLVLPKPEVTAVLMDALTDVALLLSQPVEAGVEDLARLDKLDEEFGATTVGARTVSFSFPGPCGGTVSYSGIHDSGDTDVTVLFNNFCTSDGATGVTSTVNGDMDVMTDGNPGTTGPITSSFAAESPNTLNIKTNTGESFSVAFTGLNYTYGVPGGTGTVTNPDTLGLSNFLLRNDYTGNVTKIANVNATISYLAPVPPPTSLGSGTVKVAASGTVYFPNTGYVNVATTPSGPFIIDRAAQQLESVQIVATGASNGQVTLTVGPSNPGVFTVSSNASGHTDDTLDCSELSIETPLNMAEQLIQKIQSGF